jgi:TonB family protein
MFRRAIVVVLVTLLLLLSAGCAPVKHVPVVVPAKVIAMKSPHYPIQAIEQAHEGTVVLLILVGANGQPLDVKIAQSAGYRELDKAAIAAATTWTYSPETVDGVPKDSYIKQPMNFNFGAYKEQIQERANARYYNQGVPPSGSVPRYWLPPPPPPPPPTPPSPQSSEQ